MSASKFNIITFVLFAISHLLFAQEEKVFEIKVVREVSADNKMESFIEIRDSVISFIDLLKERWGEEQDNNGVIIWNNVSIDSIEGKVQVKLYHSLLKHGESFTKTYPISKKEKSNEYRVIRIRFLQKQNDLMSSRKLTDYIKAYFMNLYSEICNTEDDLNEED